MARMSKPRMAQRVDDRRRRAVDRHLADTLCAERAVLYGRSRITVSIGGVSGGVGMM